MKAMVGLFTFAALLAGAGLASAAKDNPRKDPEAAFKKLDGNNDGKLGKEEFAKITELLKRKPDPAKAGKKVDKFFQGLDGNGDGSLTLEEFKKITEKKKAK